VTVLRLGRTVGVRSVAQTTPSELVSLITGASGADAENGSASN
jgi:ABC-type sugar transport system ATPase subunit